ncbi:hypothetical protein Patl1_07217 [Pistacia atlantica]|uniref:Uncharacterized protein n=1 Tax=Pistacia atlantica TaxID=434234 RepID=A0ACC1AEH1_9ROSI|nr:hypothetical protein Patl1_07217 [Pistacia atlantica]
MEKSDNVCVRFTGKIYAAWEFQLETFLKCKTLWGHIDGSSNGGSTAESYVANKATWDAKDNQIMSWILGSMEPHLILSLRPHRSANAMWNYLKQVYKQDNNARRFRLSWPLLTILKGIYHQDYYSGFLTLWNDYSDLVTAKVSAEGLEAVQRVHKTSQRDQFLMKLRPDFESICASLVNRDPVPTLEAYFGELLREEQRLNPQNIMEQSHVASNTISVAYAAHGKGKGHDMSTTQCYSCKKYGHIALNCLQKFCDLHSSLLLAAMSAVALQPPAPFLTRETMQEMIVSAFSALGLQGTGSSSPSWILDSGASNRMTNSLHGLSNVREYCGSSHIQTANGTALPIVAAGDVSSSFKDVLVSPNLSVNLVSVGQLVDQNYDVYFTHGGCVVQDQMSGQLIAKGPKHGRLFSLQLPDPRLPSFYTIFAL